MVIYTKIINGQIGTDIGNSNDCTWGDYDNDGYLDLYVSNNDRNYLYKNDGAGNFNRIYSGDAATDNEGSNSSTWIDLNHDGSIDILALYHTSSMRCYPYLSNDGILNRLVDKHIQLSGFVKGFLFGDYDNDGDYDLFVTKSLNSDGDNGNDLFINNNDSTFSNIQLAPITTDFARSKGANWVDYDNDDDLDLFVTNERQSNNFFYLNNGDGSFNSIITGIIPNDYGNSRGSTWIDFDNDGDLDLFVANYGFNSILYGNDGDGTFTKLLATDIGLSTSGSWADYDNDGDLDLFVANTW